MYFLKTAVVGESVLPLFGLDDTVLELGLTPNRSDALSMLGVAYEVGAILSEDMKYPEATYTESSEKASRLLKLCVLKLWKKIQCISQK